MEEGRKGGRRGVGDGREKKEKIVIIRKNLVSCHQIVQFSPNFFSQPSQNVLKES